MGTALTERQLKELQRLTRRLYLCFDSDAAGEEATLRGMELATSLGLRRARRDAAEGAGPGRRAGRVRGAARRGPRATSSTASGSSSTARRTGRRRSCAPARSCSANEDSPEWQDALRLLAGRLDLPKETLAGLTPKGGVRTLTEELSPKLLEKGDRLERNALAACVAHPGLVKLLAELSPEHFDSELHRRFRALSRRRRRARERPARAPGRARRARRAGGTGRADRQGAAPEPARAPAAPGARARRVRPDEGAADPLARVKDAILELA